MAAFTTPTTATQYYNPFILSSETNDVVFEVEGNKLHFYKSLLSLSSPVFARMFAADFRERYTKNPIPLPGKVYDGFVLFLKQLHPAYCWLPIKENDLEPLLKLADEYDVQHVKDKCEAFIKDRLKFAINTNTIMRLFWLTKTYRIHSLQEPLKKLAIDTNMGVLETCWFYKRLDSATQAEFVRARCTLLEGKPDTQQKRTVGLFVRRLKTVVHRLPDLAFPLPEECPERKCVYPRCRRGDAGQCGCNSGTNCRGLCWCNSFPIARMQVAYCQRCTLNKVGSIVKSLENFPDMKLVEKLGSEKITFDEL